MNIPEPALPLRHLKPGELLFLREAALVVTVLGSCVTVTFFSVHHGCAGICHAMLSAPPVHKPFAESPGRFKYLTEAIPHMAAHFRHLGIPTTGIEVKLFGGGNVTPRCHWAEPGRHSIGDDNIQTARRLIEAESLFIRAVNVGGQCGRKLVFNTRTGEVRHKFLPDLNRMRPCEK